MKNNAIYLPQGFEGLCCNVGLKDKNSHDCLLVKANVATQTVAMFTQSLFAGPSVVISQQAALNNAFQGLMVLSKNANVATGAQGMQHAIAVRQLAAEVLQLREDQVLLASTGITGQPYPMPKIMTGLTAQRKAKTQPLQAREAATAIMTTDTRPKYSAARCEAANIVGIAKGVGMIEPNMATLLAFFFTDAQTEEHVLDEVFRRVISKTFNATSIDTDTSTSDTTAIFANGLAGAVPCAAFEEALHTCALQLVKMIISDGEGATKSIIVNVTGARDNTQAKRVAKSVVNSPLVKTAIYGANPNWGRVLMAIGKLEQEKDILADKVKLSFGKIPVYPPALDSRQHLEALKQYLQNKEIEINIHLSINCGAFTAFGCDLSEGYIKTNAYYAT